MFIKNDKLGVYETRTTVGPEKSQKQKYIFIKSNCVSNVTI